MFDRETYMKQYRQRPEVKEAKRIRDRVYRRALGKSQHVDGAIRKWIHRIRPITQRIYKQKWKHKNPEKVKAGWLAQYIPLASYCAKCGTTENLERHHPDYSKPLEVVTLCEKCHAKTKKFELEREISEEAIW